MTLLVVRLLKNPFWYWHRLRAMSAVEIGSRLLFAMRQRRWRRRSTWIAPAATFVGTDKWSLAGPRNIEGDDVSALLAEAEQVLNGSFSLLGCQFTLRDIDWHYDPQLEVRAPVSFGFDIDYRDTTVVGNVKNIWELNRHQHLTMLAAAYCVAKDDRYADTIASQLDYWLEANPTLRGVNWHSALELSIRLISWVWIERLLRGSGAHERLFGTSGAMWSSVYWHQWLIRHCLSRGSSSNNHLIGELAGLFVAATAWPYYDESPAWRQVARRSLEKEALRQTFESGLNKEQAFSYHLFVLELFIVAGIEAERAGNPLSPKLMDAIRRMIEVVPSLTDSGGNLPRFGDADDGLAIRLTTHKSSRVDFLYRVARRWLVASVPVPRSDSGEFAADLLWYKSVDRRTTTFEYPRGSLSLDDAGLYVLATNRNTPAEFFCLADAGPVGFLSIAAHGHADALSFTLSVGGEPIIVDPGTYSYFLDVHWREYFRSTRAHNTITIDGESQSVSGGPFLWTRKAQATLIDWGVRPNGALLVAEHSGYAHLAGRPIHRRSFELNGDQLDVVDTIEGGGQHDVEWRLHFHPNCQVALARGTCRVKRRGGWVDVVLDRGLDWKLAEAAHDAGWYSPKFNCKETSVTLIGTAHAALPIRIAHQVRRGHVDA